MAGPPRWTNERIAMLLIGVLVCAPSISLLLFSVRCTFFAYNALLCEHNYGFRDWLDTTLPVLVAVIMAGRSPPPPPPARK
jgi:hypothetical protein